MIEQLAQLIDEGEQMKLEGLDFTIGFSCKMGTDAKSKHQDSRKPRPSLRFSIGNKKIYKKVKKKKSYCKCLQLAQHLMVLFRCV